jgi:endonuclease/exonuclease/phosphatase family metal-dependent hydrolase
MTAHGGTAMFSLLTLNICHGLPADRFRMDRLAFMISSIKDRRDEFSIVLLQEIFRGLPIGDALSALKSELGRFYHISYARAGGRTPLCEVGQATLSRFPVLRQRKYPVPSGRYRCILFTEIAATGCRLHVYNAHIGGTAQEMGEVFALADRLRAPEAMDIIMGDLNWDYRHERRNLILSEIYGFRVAGSGPTATLADKLSPCAVYGEAIDFSLYRNVPADMMVRARRVLTGHVRGRRMSDHAGVVCTFFRQPFAAGDTVFPHEARAWVPSAAPDSPAIPR